MTHPHTLTSLSPAYTVSEDMTHPHTLIAQVWQGDARKLVSEDMPDLKPTIMAAVPRIYARIYDKIMAGVEAKVFLFSFICCKVCEEGSCRSMPARCVRRACFGRCGSFMF